MTPGDKGGCRRQFRPYPAYKESGIEWLAQIPAHWPVKPLKRAVGFTEGPGIMAADFVADGVPLLRIAGIGGRTVSLAGCGFLAPALVDARWSHFRVQVGDLLISGSASTGFCSEVDEESAGAVPYTGLIIVRPRFDSTLRDFARWFFLSDEFLTQAQLARTGSAIQHFGPSHLSRMMLALPPLTEQRAIGAYLDRETARIDALVAKKERLIELLQEKRAALITRAVTKGLDPNVPMKDSGVEWLGKIPQHWKVMRLRMLLRGRPRNGVSPPIGPSGDTPTFSIAAVKDGVVRIDEHLKYTSIPPREASSFLVGKGDVLLLRGSGSYGLVGGAGIVVAEPPDGCIYPDILIRVRPGPRVSPWFLVNCLNSRAVRPQIETAARTAAGIWKISGDDVSDLCIPLSPLEEQLRIESATRLAISALELTTAGILKASAHLSELRTALISAAVTGKIDVRQESHEAPEDPSRHRYAVGS